jgi:hypothetical protein
MYPKLPVRGCWSIHPPIEAHFGFHSEIEKNAKKAKKPKNANQTGD